MLDLLNGKTAKDFFDAQKLKRDNGRQNMEKKRLARKRARAAKRERQRADEKHQTLVKSGLSVRSCPKCSKKFRSRKRATTHLEQCGKPAQLYKLSQYTSDKFPKCKACYPPFPSSEGTFWVPLDYRLHRVPIFL